MIRTFGVAMAVALALIGCASAKPTRPTKTATSGSDRKQPAATRAAAAPAARPVEVAVPAKPAPQPEPPPMTDADYRQQKPAPLAVQPRFIAPVPQLRRLRNGARVLLAENHALPLVAVDVVFLHGTDAEPLDKAGLAEFVADTVDEGTDTRSATQLAEQIEDLAALISAGAGRESATVHLDCLSETLPQALGRTRFSLDARLVHLGDHARGLGAPNVDGRSRGSALPDYVQPREQTT